MALKVDLEKAYDKLDWGFLKDTLSHQGLNSDFIHIILTCITRPKMRVLWNGDITQPFKFKESVKALSPLIFVLCMERLTPYAYGGSSRRKNGGQSSSLCMDPHLHISFC